jgi:hypothetical protein
VLGLPGLDENPTCNEKVRERENDSPEAQQCESSQEGCKGQRGSSAKQSTHQQKKRESDAYSQQLWRTELVLGHVAVPLRDDKGQEEGQ